MIGHIQSCLVISLIFSHQISMTVLQLPVIADEDSWKCVFNESSSPAQVYGNQVRCSSPPPGELPPNPLGKGKSRHKILNTWLCVTWSKAMHCLFSPKQQVCFNSSYQWLDDRWEVMSLVCILFIFCLTHGCGAGTCCWTGTQSEDTVSICGAAWSVGISTRCNST